MIAGIVAARMESTRLPGKVLFEINGKTIIQIMVDRMKFSKNQEFAKFMGILRSGGAPGRPRPRPGLPRPAGRGQPRQTSGSSDLPNPLSTQIPLSPLYNGKPHRHLRGFGSRVHENSWCYIYYM